MHEKIITPLPTRDMKWNDKEQKKTRETTVYNTGLAPKLNNTQIYNKIHSRPFFGAPMITYYYNVMIRRLIH